ncbi:MAG: sugar nucleotide-binding protein, partial [Spirochaetes bacterium]|nr:sugar nucleotide-binding protein [Spirochaetota bacterium]
MIWIIGNKGMLGQELCHLLDREQVPYVGSDLEVSLLVPRALLRFGRDAHWIVNCAAYTAVDRAEDEPEK